MRGCRRPARSGFGLSCAYSVFSTPVVQAGDCQIPHRILEETMLKTLTAAAIAEYERDGFYFPIPVLGAEEVQRYRSALEAFERDNGGPLRGPMMFKTHLRSEEHTSELQSLMRISYAVFCL